MSDAIAGPVYATGIVLTFILHAHSCHIDLTYVTDFVLVVALLETGV